MTIKTWNDDYQTLIELSKNPSNIYVFGSNNQGIHGAGAALIAKQTFGAVQGNSQGFQGRSYAIITKDLRLGIRSISLEAIQKQLHTFFDFAQWNMELNFYVAKIGCGLAGYKVSEMKQVVQQIKWDLIDNVYFPKEFAD